ncbi:cysteine-rich small domain-containing protein [Candidatus Epulonipiscium viviparus]|uniref:cysteine-rich small domain-containing protein n=1 Tax=Candidatus Epulonipiscium viviparus TaxID=420336 RepID=UPI002738093F|nr:cysteine-rich small domain-containing protein [Candidatus Epulopiscium viviparus]
MEVSLLSAYKQFQNSKCEFFPCHKVSNEQAFNCFFCYCPLYLLKEDCGGDFAYTASGIKDCSNCTKPHDEGGYDYVQSKIRLVIDRAKK